MKGIFKNKLKRPVTEEEEPKGVILEHKEQSYREVKRSYEKSKGKIELVEKYLKVVLRDMYEAERYKEHFIATNNLIEAKVYNSIYESHLADYEFYSEQLQCMNKRLAEIEGIMKNLCSHRCII